MEDKNGNKKTKKEDNNEKPWVQKRYKQNTYLTTKE
jgi:hypothetical protein